MFKYKFIITIAVLLSTIFLSGCNDPDGKWDPIQITVNGDKCNSSTFKVAHEGGEYKIYSKNYGSLWLWDVKENGTSVWPKDLNRFDFENIHLSSDWYELQYDAAGNIVVVIQPMGKDTSTRTLYLNLEVGDAFGAITLQQE